MKQFLRHILLLVAMLVATANAWAEWPEYKGTIKNVSGRYYVVYDEAEDDLSASGSGESKDYNFGGPGENISFQAMRSRVEAIGNLTVTEYTDNTSLSELYKANPEAAKYSWGTAKEYKDPFGPYSLNRSANRIVFKAGPSGSYVKKIKNIKVPMLSYMAKTNLTSWPANTAMIGAADETKQVTVDWSNTSALTYEIKGTGASQFSCAITNNASAGKYGTATITITYKHKEVNTHTATLILSNGETISLAGTTLDRYDAVLDWTIANVDNSTQGEYHVGDYATITDTYTLKNKTTGNVISLPVTFTIKTLSRSSIYQEDGDSNYDNDVLSIEGEELKAKNAGVATITASFAGNSEYKPFTKELTLTIKKHDLKAFIVQSTAVWNEIINNPFYLTDGLSDFNVGKSSDVNVATYDANTKEIQTYFTNGTASFQITRPEDYKYNKLDETLSLEVQPAGGCDVLNATEEVSLEYSVLWEERIYEPTSFTGIPNELTFYTYKTAGTAVGDIEVQQYVNNKWIAVKDHSNNDVKIDATTSYKKYGPYTLDESATKIRFYNNYGSYWRYFKDVQVTRKTYLRPTLNSLTLPQTTKGKQVSASFDLNWSTCSDEIVLLSTNSNFVLSKSSINATSGRGTNTITVTYDANSGSQSGTIVIYDQSQKIEIPVSCEVKAKLATEIIYTGEATYPDTPDGILYPFYVKDENGNTVMGATITLETSNEDILSFDADKIYPHCGGNVTLTATYAGDNTHESCSLTANITVPYCQREIVWERSYLNFATDENGYIEEKRVLDATINPESEITYQLHTVTSTPFAEIVEEGGEYFVRVFGEGHGYIVAIANECLYEGQMYDATYKIKELRVSGAGACDPNSLLIWGDGDTEPFVYKYSTNSSEKTRIYNITGLPADKMTFGAHAASSSYENRLVISFSTESEGDNWIGEHRQEVVSGSNYNWNYSCSVPAGAKRVRFQSEASLTIYFNGVTIPQQTYIRPSVESIEISDAIVNVPFERTFSVDYSNVRLLQWEVSNDNDLGLKVVANQEVNNDCDLYGTYTFTLTGESPYPQSNVTETITFFTSAGDVVNIPVTITATLSEPFYFNVTENGDWKNPTNWTYLNETDHNMLPDKQFPVVISKAMTINEGELVAYGITIEEGSSVNIQPKGGLTLHAGGFTNVTENNFEVHNNLEGAGFVRVSKYFKKLGGQMPKMKVHFTTKANMNNGGNKDAAWQYIGAPGAETQMQVVNTSTLYLRSEEKGWVRQWDSNASLTPFAGYAFTQKDQPSIDFTPRLVTDNQTITLTYTEGGMNGDNLWANSYMAPIDIKKLGEEDFSGNVDQIVYLYNCGSWNEWNKDQNAISSAEILPGRYYAIPVGSARALDATYDQTVIPPMQGVYMVAKSGGGSLTLNYEKHVWNCESNEMNRALRIAAKRTAEEDYLSSILRIRLQINSQSSGADRMYLIQDSTCTANYDNGFDAPKQMTDGLLNLYTNEACGKMEISATDNIDGMYLGFAAGDDDVYTMTFTSLIGDDLYLYDVEQDTLIGMSNGETYEFAATAKSTNDMRFQILVNPDLSDYQPNGGNGDVTTNLNDVPMQQLWVHDEKVYISHASANSILEVYTVSGMPVARYAIGYAPCTLNLSDLPTGVYMLRLNDTIYKFVCN